MIKFLIIRLSSIGDIVLTTPVVRILATQLPDAEVHFFVKSQFVEILKNNPYIKKIHIYDGNIADNIRTFKQENFDYIIDLHKNLRTFRVRNSLSSLWFSFDKLNFEKWILVNFKKNILPHKHIVERYLQVISKFDVKYDGKGLDYFIAPDDEINIAERFGELHKQGFVAIVIGAKHFTKQIPIHKIISIIKGISMPVILLGGKENKSAADEIEKSTDSEMVKNSVGKLSLGQSASIVRQAKIVITPDTGLMHIAAAFGKKIVSLWGNTVPEFGMSPYLAHSDSKIFEVKDLSCRPCSKIGYNKCPKKHFRCMEDIEIKDVIDTVKKLWE